VAEVESVRLLDVPEEGGVDGLAGTGFGSDTIWDRPRGAAGATEGTWMPASQSVRQCHHRMPVTSRGSAHRARVRAASRSRTGPPPNLMPRSSPGSALRMARQTRGRVPPRVPRRNCLE
jgi:hypothetical protein